LLIGTLFPDSGDLRFTITASTPCPVQLAFPALPSAALLHETIEQTIPHSAYYDDVHGTPAWRRHMTLLFAEEIRRELTGKDSA
jgi:hypothetical protein